MIGSILFLLQQKKIIKVCSIQKKNVVKENHIVSWEIVHYTTIYSYLGIIFNIC